MTTPAPTSERTPTALCRAADLGKYRVIAELARGGMGVVYLGIARGPGGFRKILVLKVLKPELAEQPAFVAMFLDEARLAARLAHPNVVQTHEVGSAEGRPYLAMEYLEGQTLHRILRRSKRCGAPLPLADHLQVLIDVLAGLHHAHELLDDEGAPLGVVHRDVSPHNVLVTYDGQVKVVDFGIAKALDSSSETRTGVLKGKVSYMAPEQTRGDAVDRRADLFAVGVMLWEAVTGRRLWLGKSEVAILQERLAARVPRPRDVRPDVPEALERIALRALADDPSGRYATAAAMRADLEDFVREAHLDAGRGRDLGASVAALFADARALTRSLLDAQRRALRDGEDAGASVPLLRLPVASTRGGTASGASSAHAQVTGTMSLAWHEDSQIATLHAGPPSLDARRAAAAPGGGHGARTIVIAAATAVVAGAIAAASAVVLLGRVPPPCVAASAPSPPVPTSLAADREARPRAKLHVEVVPREATVSLDGVPLPTAPCDADLPRDGSLHVVRLESPGFVSRVESLRADADVRLVVALERAPRARAAAWSGPALSRTEPSAPAVPPAGDVAARHPAGREIETANPYARP
jgi:predicted Ser/Thr protein kinase